MDAHFDPSVYHPSFGSQSPNFHLSDNVFTRTLSHFHQTFHEYGLPDDVVENAVHDACDFLHMNDLDIQGAKLTGVYVNDPTTLNDDVLGFNRQQLLDMGVHDEKTLSLICTHEAAHCLLQNLSSTHCLTSWQTELSCDAFMGARAAVEGLDLETVKATLSDTEASPTHPDGQLRLHYIDVGRRIGEDLKSHGIPVTADNIMERLSVYLHEDAGQILYQEVVAHEVATEHGGGDNHLDSGEQRGYTREEINRKISKAKLDMAREEANMRHLRHMINSKADMGEPNGVEASSFKSAHDRYIKAKDDLWKWEHTHAEAPKGFVDVDESAVESDSFHGVTASELEAAHDYAESKDKAWREKYSEMEKAEKKYGKNSSEYRKAKAECDAAASELKAAQRRVTDMAGDFRGFVTEDITSEDVGSFHGFKPSYTDAEIDNLRSKVSDAEYRKNSIAHELENWRSKESLLRGDKDHLSDHAHASAKVFEYERKLENANYELKEARARLNNAL